MKKFYFLIAMSAALFAGCQSTNPGSSTTDADSLSVAVDTIPGAEDATAEETQTDSVDVN